MITLDNWGHLFTTGNVTSKFETVNGILGVRQYNKIQGQVTPNFLVGLRCLSPFH